MKTLHVLRAALAVALLPLAAAAQTPTHVSIPGSLDSELGCPGDWQPECTATQLAYDAGDDLWEGTFLVPAGDYEYKVALNDTWDWNYGLHAVQGGPNIPLSLVAPQTVHFFYSHATHWVTDDVGSEIATATGDFQSELGCSADWDPECLRSWLQDPDGDGVYTFGTSALPPGTYQWKVALDRSWSVNYGEGGTQNGANLSFTVPAAGVEVQLVWNAATHVPRVVLGHGDLSLARAHWLARGVIAWDAAAFPAGTVFALHADPDGALSLTSTGVSGGTSYVLTRDPAGLPDDLKARFPHLASYAAFTLPPEAIAAAPELLTGRLAVSAVLGGVVQDATSLQLPGVLDDLYADAASGAALGPTVKNGVPTLRVWAPTAKEVALLLYDTSTATEPRRVAMARDAGGVWSATGTPAWLGKYYLYEVRVYAPSTHAVETNLVTDPYSVSLSTNSRRSQLVSLDDPALMPSGWRTLGKPRLAAPEDIVLYELHVRDFSANDPSVPDADKGTFAAFALPSTSGTKHLERLAKAGVTHVHLLPAFDFATVDEDRSTWLTTGDLSADPPSSTLQREAVSAVASRDGFNWGYDPLHYTVPEGSYARDPDGSERIVEFRQMVQALAGKGLRVVMDVVYNHTNASGQAATSVLDRIVPGYYHRLDADGAVATSTCCQNTATEHRMMEKLMVDSVVTWARAYKVDGFRFDLMGHHMRSNMLAVRAALDALTPAKDGVDGKAVYVYGEGWDFGEVANDARGVNATQANMAGTCIGTFNDRLRDAVRGGGPFSARREQGFATGLYVQPNFATSGSEAEQKARLNHYADLVRLGMAGNLADLALVRSGDGAVVRGAELDYNGAPAGYAQEPADTITYISAHDNEIWFDAMNVKENVGLALEDRVRDDRLGLSIVALSQGIPFFHAGDEILRSKSEDGNSYDSGDWFNRIDWTYRDNGWASGIPLGVDGEYQVWLEDLFTDPSIDPRPEDIEGTLAHFSEMLRIRRSSGLFRLRSGAGIAEAIRFFNVGPDQIPGLVVMRLASPAPRPGEWAQVAVVVNATPFAQAYGDPEFERQAYQLHPVLRSSRDPVVRTAAFDCAAGTFTVPARTVAVFVAQAPYAADAVCPAP